jgi:hypothetical protein
MNENQLKSPHHESTRKALRLWGPIVAGIGLIFTIIGLASFFSSFGQFESPRYFWCAFVGLPLIAVGLAMCKYGYLGSIVRYMAGETAPVAKDAVNYMGEGVQPGVKAVAKAVTEGVLEAKQEQANK